jgi:wyosine [tRNA(Phe)-imidazoG37] synthetase (radical SAM superfamily)
MNHNYIFGPVPSRRLGISLGVDLVPYKTCSLDCVYCECGKTTKLTAERAEYVPLEEVIDELDKVLNTSPELDYITFSGSGEPTLHSGIGRVLKHIKSKYPAYRVCLLTNGTLLGEKEIIDDLSLLDLIIPSLDAADEETYAKINRPAPGLTLDNLIAGIAGFKKSNDALMWLEIFIVPGVNDSEKEILEFKEAVKRIQPDKVQLNTLDRPGTENWLEPAGQNISERFVEELKELVPVEVVGKFVYREPQGVKQLSESETELKIQELITRRPCTIDDLSCSLGLSTEVVNHCLLKLQKSGKVINENRERGKFYLIMPD